MAKTFQIAAVRSACQRGGVAEAKAMMKATVKKAKAAGTEMKCSSCHTEQKTYGLKPNAVADLKKWL